MAIGAPDFAIGTLSKVLSLSPAEQAFHFRTQEGKLGRMAGVDFLPELGDVVIINNNGWVRTDPNLWIAGNSVAVVRQILGAERVLIEGALGLTTTSNRLGLELADGNTVEYSDAEGIARVISETPVRSRRFGDDDSLNAQDYRVQVKDGPGLTFSDFGGYADVVSRARELIDIQFRRRKNLDKIGARPLRGVMFSGPPGTGKTHLARIIAHEAEADFYLISGPSIVSKWLGESEDILRRIFEAARESESGRAVIFFDEIDSIAERRSGDTHEASKRLVAQLLTLMDGFDDKGRGIMVIAATNRVETLDPALTRPGRFDWEISFDLPTDEDRFEILVAAAKRLNVAKSVPIKDVAQATKGWTAAELASLWTEAALVTAADGRDQIAGEDLAQAVERVASRPRRSEGGGNGE